jgi:hypothetical protein
MVKYDIIHISRHSSQVKTMSRNMYNKDQQTKIIYVTCTRMT